MKEKESFLDKEHTELLEELQFAAESGGKLGETFSEILSLFSYHLDREEETVVPLLEYLSERTVEGNIADYAGLIQAAEGFDEEYESMIKEHSDLNTLSTEAESMLTDDTAKFEQLIHKLRHHIALEEEVLYPAAIGAGDIIDYEKPLKIRG